MMCNKISFSCQIQIILKNFKEPTTTQLSPIEPQTDLDPVLWHYCDFLIDFTESKNLFKHYVYTFLSSSLLNYEKPFQTLVFIISFWF